MYYKFIKTLYWLKNRRKGVKTVDSLAQVEGLLKECEALDQTSPQRALEFARSWFYMPDLGLTGQPNSQEYFDYQKRMYEAFSGKPWGTFDVVAQDDDICFNNLADLYPYALKDYHVVSSHLKKIGYWIGCMDLKPNDKIIEFGAGSAELAIFLAQTGHDILATDISQTYVNLVKKKAEFLKLPLRAAKYDMSQSNSTEKYDVAIFCEAFHHSKNHIDLLENLRNLLNTNGRAYLCGEPITYYPYPWGVRTDGESIWMARKLGWLELGFDKHYFKTLAHSMGFDFKITANKSIDHAASVICLQKKEP